MLIRFKAENWKSFPELEFCAIAGRERQHGGRLAEIARPKMKLTPISAIYGGNASGKSNFFGAVDFARRYILYGVKPDQPIGVRPFAFNTETLKRPTSFTFEILVKDSAFRYSFTATRAEVLYERLEELRPTGSRLLFSREGEDVVLGKSLKDSETLAVFAAGTRKNVLFLTNSVFLMREEFRPVYDWFKNTLLLISPDSSFNPTNMRINSRNPFLPEQSEFLQEFDVGIERIESIDISSGNVPAAISAEFERAPEGVACQMGSYLVRRTGGEQKVQKMLAVHAVEDDPSAEVWFELAEESEGTRRLLDLIPVFSALRDPSRSYVVFIDEIDRSLHHLLTRRLIADYLNSRTGASRSQLFFTTHDALLMDQEIMRRDELWLADKENDRSTLLSLDQFQIRHDKSLLNAYLYGRFGGVPKLSYM